MPGETALVAAAIYAGTTGNLSITGVLGAALTGAIVGDSLWSWVGRRLGWPFLVRHGPRVGLTSGRLELGRIAAAGLILVCRTETRLIADAQRRM